MNSLSDRHGKQNGRLLYSPRSPTRNEPHHVRGVAEDEADARQITHRCSNAAFRPATRRHRPRASQNLRARLGRSRVVCLRPSGGAATARRGRSQHAHGSREPALHGRRFKSTSSFDGCPMWADARPHSTGLKLQSRANSAIGQRISWAVRRSRRPKSST